MQLAAQDQRLAERHGDRAGRGPEHDTGDPQRRVQRERDNRVDEEVPAGQRGGEPGSLQAEERAREQQAHSLRRQRERPDHHRLGDEVGGVRGELPPLVDEARDRLREDGHERRRRNQRQADLPHPVRHGVAEVDVVAAGRESRQRRKQDRRDRHREDPLRQHVDPERLVDRCRRLVVHERAEERVDQQAEVDEPERDRDGEHQLQHPDHVRIPPVELEREPAAEAPQPRHREQELDDGAP